MRRLARLLIALPLMPIMLSEQAAAEAVNLPEPLRTGAAELRERAATDSDAYSLVRALALEVGPRLAGSDGDRAAVAWALTTLMERDFEAVRAEDVAVPRWERGSTRVELTQPYAVRLAAETLGGSIGTSEYGIEAPVVGAANIAELQAMSTDAVAGKIVYLGQRMTRSRDLSGYLETVGNRVHGAAVAAELGAVGLVLRSVATGNHRLAHTGTMRYRPNVRRIPAFALSNPDADLLEYQLAGGQPVSLRLYSTARALGPARSANVIGEIRGSRRPEQIVLLGAHLDAWDLGSGAIDNAAGVAIVIEAARLVATMGRPARTLRIVLYANEEFGLSGANDYFARHRDTLGAHVVALEADMGAAPVWRFDSRVPDSALPLVSALHEALEPLGIERGDNAAFGGADISVLRDHGVPVLQLTQDMTHYFDWHHSASDTLDKVVPDELAQAVAAWATLIYLLANMDADLGRLPVPDPAG